MDPPILAARSPTAAAACDTAGFTLSCRT